MKTTKTNLNALIEWSSSCYNEWKKNDVLEDIIFRVEKGEDCFVKYCSGCYSESSHESRKHMKWTGGQYALEIKNGVATLNDGLSNATILERPTDFMYYVPAKTIFHKVEKWGIPAEEFQVIGQDKSNFFINFRGIERHISKEDCTVAESLDSAKIENEFTNDECSHMQM